jgi:hypothetical protein
MAIARCPRRTGLRTVAGRPHGVEGAVRLRREVREAVGRVPQDGQVVPWALASRKPVARSAAIFIRKGVD